MKIAMIGRSSLFKVTGGDTIQMVRTSEALKRLGIESVIHLASDRIDYTSYDLLHLFNLLRPADHLAHIRKSRKKYVVSTIYLDYTMFDRYGRSLPYRWLFRALGKHPSEYFKNLYRFARKQDVMASREYLLGQKRSIAKILSRASVILPNSRAEYLRVVKDTGFTGQYVVIPNGIDTGVFSTIPADIRRQEKVVCVAQVYGMKNQHRLIEACMKLDIPLEIIGKAPPNHTAYYEHCRRMAGSRVQFFDFMPQTELIRHYAGAKVHALPSWFETTGLTSLEAGAMGCNLVVGEGGDTKDYFRDLAWYCQAGDLESLVKALEGALHSGTGEKLRDLVLSEYTWEKAAQKTLQAYQTALNE